MAETYLSELDASKYELSAKALIDSVEAQKPLEELTIYINSFGGDVGEAKAICEYLRNIKQRGVKITTCAQAYCSSAAILVFLEGDVRKIDKHNEAFFVHLPEFEYAPGGSLPQMKEAVKSLEKIADEIATLYEQSAKITKEKALALMSESRSLTVEEVLKHGFATEITDFSVKNLAQYERVLNCANNKTEKPIKKYLSNFIRMNYKAINKKATWAQRAEAALKSKTVAQLAAENAFKEFWSVTKNQNEPPKNLLIEIEDGQRLFIYSENAELEGKRAVIAAEDGTPSETPAPDGEHRLEDGRVIFVKDGLIESVADAQPVAEDAKPPKKEQEEMQEEKEEKTAKNAQETPPVAGNAPATVAENAPATQNTAKNMSTKQPQKGGTQPVQNFAIEDTAREDFLWEGEVSDLMKDVLGAEHLRAAADHEYNFNPLPAAKARISDALKVKNRANRAKNANSIAFVSNDYIGDASAFNLAAAMLNADDISYFKVINGVKKELILPRLAASVTLQNRNAIFTPSGNDLSVDYAKRLVMSNYGVMEQIDTLGIKDSWHANTLRTGSINDYDPRQLAQFWANNILELVSEANAILRWTGKSGLASYAVSGSFQHLASRLVATFSSAYEGVLGILNASALTRKSDLADNAITHKTISGITLGTTTVLTLNNITNLQVGDYLTVSGLADGGGGDVAANLNGVSAQIKGFPAANSVELYLDTSSGITLGTPNYAAAVAKFINESNSLQILKTVTALIPKSVYNKPDFRILVPPMVARYYGSLIESSQEYIQLRETDYLRQKIAVVKHLPDNTIVATRTGNAGNLYYGVDLVDDSTRAKLTYGVDQDQVHKLRLDMKSGVQVGYEAEAVLIS